MLWEGLKVETNTLDLLYIKIQIMFLLTGLQPMYSQVRGHF